MADFLVRDIKLKEHRFSGFFGAGIMRICSVSLWQKVKTRLLRRGVYIGTFQILNNCCTDCLSPNTVTDFLDYYMFWCSSHRRYEVSYRHGFDEVLVCEESEDERRKQLKS